MDCSFARDSISTYPSYHQYQQHNGFYKTETKVPSSLSFNFGSVDTIRQANGKLEPSYERLVEVSSCGMCDVYWLSVRGILVFEL